MLVPTDSMASGCCSQLLSSDGCQHLKMETDQGACPKKSAESGRCEDSNIDAVVMVTRSSTDGNRIKCSNQGRWSRNEM